MTVQGIRNKNAWAFSFLTCLARICRLESWTVNLGGNFELVYLSWWLIFWKQKGSNLFSKNFPGATQGQVTGVKGTTSESSDGYPDRIKYQMLWLLNASLFSEKYWNAIEMQIEMYLQLQAHGSCLEIRWQVPSDNERFRTYGTPTMHIQPFEGNWYNDS